MLCFDPTGCIHTSSDSQHSSSGLCKCKQNGQSAFQEPVSTSITGLGLVPLQEPYDFSRAPSGLTEPILLVDKESRTDSDSSEWALETQIFHRLMEMRGPCTVDLFASRLSAKLPTYFSWRMDPGAKACGYSNTVVE